MSGKKVDVLYQAPGSPSWRPVESAVEKVGTLAEARRAVRALLSEADAEVAAELAKRTSLSPLELFERDMARALGAWERYIKIEAKNMWRGVEHAFDRNRKP